MIHSNEANMPALYAAFALAQSQFGKIVKNTEVTMRPRDASKPTRKFKYADLDEILTAVRPALNANGIGLVQPVVPDAEGTSWLVTALVHKDGGALISRVLAPDLTEDPKVYGGLVSFMRRYMVSAMLGIAADADLDDDGRQPGDPYGDNDRGGPRVAAPPPARKSAARAPTTDDAALSVVSGHPAPGAGGAVGAGQLKNLQVKIKSLDITPEAVAALLAKVGVRAIDAGMSLGDWTKVKREIDAAARAV